MTVTIQIDGCIGSLSGCKCFAGVLDSHTTPNGSRPPVAYFYIALFSGYLQTFFLNLFPKKQFAKNSTVNATTEKERNYENAQHQQPQP
jgi:hypothetical protein